jgi:large subunit ribosomal protein L24
MQKIRRGDEVEVIAGKDIGVRGRVLRVDPKKNRVVVNGVNIVRKHQRPQQAGRSQIQPGIIEFEAPINLSNVMLVCPHTDLPTRVGFRVREDGIKIRVSKRSGQDID